MHFVAQRATKSRGGRRHAPGLFNPAGTARFLRASPLFAIGPAEPGPALRRGALLAVPIGAALAFEFGFDYPTKGAIATGALLAGFTGMDAPARARAGWQAAAAPLIGVAAALGVLSGQWAPAAVLTMGLLGALAGYCFAVSLRMAIFGLSVALGLVIAQGLFLPLAEIGPALLYTTIGGLLQVLWSLLVWAAGDRNEDGGASGWNRPAALAAARANLTMRSPAMRHAIRFGAALAAGVALYNLLGLRQHGFWIPLTILFVMRPDRGETNHRLILRALGTALGLVLATALAEAFAGDDLAVGIVLTAAAALTFGLLTVQYALFTAAITVYVVLAATNLGERAIDAAGQRALGTALGIAVAGLAFALWPNRPEGGEEGRQTAGLRPPTPEAR